MSDMVYRPGAWQVVVEESGVAALPADASSDKVVALSAMLSRGVPSLTEVIDVLSGGAITGLGSFAVALIDAGGTRFAVRGAVTVRTGYDEGFSGEDITTWSERFIAGGARFEVAFGDAADVPEYPIRSGVVLAAGIRVGDPFQVPEADAAEPSETGASDPSDADAVESPAVVADQPEAEPGDEPEPVEDAEPGPEPAAEPGPESGLEAEPEPTPEPESIPEPEPTPEEAASDGIQTETITPEEVLLARGSSEHPEPEHPEPEHPASAAEPADLSETIAPPTHAEAAAPSASVPEADAGLTVPPPIAVPEPALAADAPAVDIGDHDGATISLAEARRLRSASTAPDAPTEIIPTFPGEAVAARPARIRLSTGQVVELDRPVIIGRKPRSTRASGSTLPHLVAVDSPQSDISRNHLEVRPEGDSVVVIDLHTTNGSTLLRQDSDPVRLHPGEPTLALGGDVIDLGDGVTVSVEEFG